MADFLKKNKRRVIFSLLAGIPEGLFLTLGYQLQHNGKIPFSGPLFWLLTLLFAALGTVITYFLLLFFEKRQNAKASKPLSKRSKILLYAGIFILTYLLWGIQLYAIYPGFFNYDAPNQWLTYANSAVTAHHPVLHTYLVGKCIHLSFIVFKNALPGCALYILFQMLITDLALLRIQKFLCDRKAPVVLNILSMFWFAFSPMVVLNVMSVTKDSMFAPFFVVFLLECADAAADCEAYLKKWYHLAVWCISAFFAAILRNNAIYIMVPVLIYLIIRYRKQKRIFALAGVFVALIVYLGPVCSAITVEGVNEREYLSVPTQQIMRIYHLHKDELKPAEKEMIEDAFEEEALLLYVPKIADVAKGNLKRDVFDAKKGEYARLWFNLGCRYPGEYINSFLMGNYGFWYPFATLALTADGAEGYFVCRCYTPVWDSNKIPAIANYYKHFENSEITCKYPFTIWIFAPATYFMIAYFSLICFWNQKRKEVIIPAIALLVWATFLLGPVALVRYVGFLFYMLPVLAGVLFTPSEEKNRILEENMVK